MKLSKSLNLVTHLFFFKLYHYFRQSDEKNDLHYLKNNDLTGPYSSWELALKASIGYNSDIILEKTKNALLKVKTGEAIYERDSVLFDEIQYSWPLLTGLMWVAAQSNGRLTVLDFGGSLGSTYYQNRMFLKELPEVQWCIVEQPNHVEIGKKYFEDNTLKFYTSIEECLSENDINVIILSSVLHYLKEPYTLLDSLLQSHSKYIIIDRTPYSNEDRDTLYVQKIPPTIFDASYPMWVFSLNKFKEYIKHENIIAEFYGFENGLFGLEWKGFIIKNNNE